MVVWKDRVSNPQELLFGAGDFFSQDWDAGWLMPRITVGRIYLCPRVVNLLNIFED